MADVRETEQPGWSRRMFLRAGAAGAAAVGAAAGNSFLVPNLAGRGLLSPDGVFGAASIAWADNIYTEAFPTSPLILSPFTDPLSVPKPLKPADTSGWAVKPNKAKQNSYDDGTNNAEKHQIWPDSLAPGYNSEPIVYKLEVKAAEQSFTTSKVLPIDRDGKPTVSFDATGKSYPAGTVRDLPKSVRCQL